MCVLGYRLRYSRHPASVGQSEFVLSFEKPYRITDLTEFIFSSTTSFLFTHDGKKGKESGPQEGGKETYIGLPTCRHLNEYKYNLVKLELASSDS